MVIGDKLERGPTFWYLGSTVGVSNSGASRASTVWVRAASALRTVAAIDMAAAPAALALALAAYPRPQLTWPEAGLARQSTRLDTQLHVSPVGASARAVPAASSTEIVVDDPPRSNCPECHAIVSAAPVDRATITSLVATVTSAAERTAAECTTRVGDPAMAQKDRDPIGTVWTATKPESSLVCPSRPENPKSWPPQEYPPCTGKMRWRMRHPKRVSNMSTEGGRRGD